MFLWCFIGWHNSDGVQPDVLQQTTLNIITNAKCKETYPNLFTNMICTIADGKDTCQVSSFVLFCRKLNETFNF